MGRDITTEKNVFPFIFNIFFKKKLLKNLAKFLFTTSRQNPARSQENNVRAKSWALSLFYWELISYYDLGSKERDVYVTSSNDVNLCDFKWCLLVGFLWLCLCHLQYTTSQHPKLCLTYETCMHICSISHYFFAPKQTKEDCLYVYPCLIDKSSLSNSLLYKITQTRAVMFHVSRFKLGRLS